MLVLPNRHVILTTHNISRILHSGFHLLLPSDSKVNHRSSIDHRGTGKYKVQQTRTLS